ncbi:MAG TPA: hypothetical protein VEK07_13200 [Polyangiaceae bacterium]|nr:hypothetical protein [Polyangiaceae bacterium]
MSSRVGLDDQPPPGSGRLLVFVSDPTAEAETIARALRAGGATVIEVPLSMLVARAAVQQPRVVLVDADSHGALEVVARMRELPHADDVHVVFMASPGGLLSTVQDARAHEGSALFLRPVDVIALVHDVESLSGVRYTDRAAAHSSTPPPSVAIATPRRSSSSPSLPPPGIRSTSLPAPSEGAGSTEPSARPTRMPVSTAIGVSPPVSPELLQLLAEAEERMTVAADPPPNRDAVPSPEQELEAVLPAELLAALDEPLEAEDETEVPPAPRSTGAGRLTREHTSEGGLTRTTGASSGGATPSAGSRPGTGDFPETPLPSEAPPKDDAPAPTSLPPQSSTVAHASVEPGWLTSGTGDTTAVLARAIASRTSGSLCLVSGEIERRVVLREGDIVTCASSADDESLIAFLGARGDLPRETVRRLAPKFAPFGRHAGAALVARGYLLQDQMWPTLRAHAEWVIGHIIQSGNARVLFEMQPAGRLSGEPSVFGGSTGAEVFVEVIRRIVTPTAALQRLGSSACRIAPGPAADLLAECVLSPAELESLRDAGGRALGDVLEAGQDADFASAIYALAQLGVVDMLPAVGGPELQDEPAADPSALDAAAIRERVRARLELVEEGDYFAILGVSREATGYEIRRAFLELRRSFDPSQLLSPDLADLLQDVRSIASVLEEAYEILKDTTRRERYRRAIEVVPQ